MTADGVRDWALGVGAIVTVAKDQGPKGETHWWVAVDYRDNVFGRHVLLTPWLPDGFSRDFPLSDLPDYRWVLSLLLTVHMPSPCPWPITGVSA